MAQNKKKTRQTKKGAGRGEKRTESEIKLQSEIGIVLVLALSVLIFLSNLGLGGLAGKAISSVFFGIFGLPSYLFPILFFFTFIFLTANRASSVARRKMIGLWGDYLLLSGLFSLFTTDRVSKIDLIHTYQECSYYKSGGGLIGDGLVKIFGTFFGLAGAYLFVIVGLIIFTIIMTQKPLLASIREGSSQAYEAARERHVRRMEERRLRQEEEEERELYLLEEEERRTLGDEIRKQRESQAGARRERLERSRSKKRRADEEGTRPSLITLTETAGEEEARPALVEERPFLLDDIVINGMVDEDPPATADTDAPDLLPEAGGEQEAAGQELSPAVSLPPAEGNKKGAGRDSDAGEEKVTAKDTEEALDQISREISSREEEEKPFVFPSLDLLKPSSGNSSGDSKDQLRETAARLQETLHSFGVEVTINHISCGPTVTRYEMQPQQGVKVSRIVSLTDDIKLNLAAADIRIEAPIPGKAAIGIEVPNKTNVSVGLRELLETTAFEQHKSKLAFAVGKDIGGQPVVTDIEKMPHLLIAGATGSGKSVCINTLIMSILYKARPDEVKFIMIDPKVVELSVYNGIPHLLIPVVTDPKKASGALNWAVAEMTDRYSRFAEFGVRDLKGYNAKLEEMPGDERGEKPPRMSRIVVIVDELADLMMVAQNEVEDAICRLAQLARAAGIHLIIATQRPSVNVITGLIKANMPSRIALSVTSGVDSRTILDMNGAEKLLGKGDMLFYPQGYQKPARVQGAYLSDDEIADVVGFLKENHTVSHFDKAIEEKISQSIQTPASGAAADNFDEVDSYFADAGRLIISKDKASISMLQRAYRIGFTRAARLMDQLCEAGVVGEEEGTKPRKILMSMEDFNTYLEEN